MDMCDLFDCSQAKVLIGNIVQRGQGGPDMPDMNGGPPGSGPSMLEIFVPGNKVGLVIGKGGETIRQLQVQLDSD